MKKPVRIVLTVTADVVLTGVALCVFALFHHVLPRDYSDAVVAASVDNSEIHAITTAAETTTPQNTAAETEQTKPEKTGNSPSQHGEHTGGHSKTTSEENTPEDADIADTAEQSAATDSADTETADTQTAVGGSEIISTDTYYKSDDITVTLTDYDVDGYVYHVEDIYISNAENLKTAFAYDTYGKGYREGTPEMAERNNAIAAINGDYYGNGDSGVVIRNGVLYRSDPDADVCVMYYDGTMKCFSELEFDGEAEMAAGAYQAWCFGPTLVSDGVVGNNFGSGFISGENPRSAIGYFSAGHYCFVSVDGRSSESDGITLKQLAELMKNLGCTLAYNLDGGKSSVMTFGDNVANVPSDGGRTISDIIYIAEIEE